MEEDKLEQTAGHGGKREGSGAPLGNKNSSKNNRMWGETIKRKAIQNPEKMGRIVDKLFDKAEEGDLAAMREIGDRIDGKAVATTELGTIDGQDSPINVTLKFIKPEDVDRD